jgi:undecaprenyl-diphosphatase
VIDVAVHVGTLGAVMLYFREDVARAFRGMLDLLTGKAKSDNARLAGLLIVATIPVTLAGLVIHVTGLSDHLRSTAVVGWTILGFGLVLFWADRTGPEHRVTNDWSLKDAVTMGLWQAIALIPGTSRSGITITGGRFLGFRREDAARIAMLMSIPTILASGTLLGIDVATKADAAAARDGVLAAAFAFVAAYASLALMMRLLRSVSFTPYVIYRVILGVILLWIAYS